MGINSRHSVPAGRRRASQTKQPSSKQNRRKYENEEQKQPLNWRLWFTIIIIIISAYMFLKQIESYLIQEVYLVNKEHIPSASIKKLSSDELDDLIKQYQYVDKLPYYSDELSVILIVLDSYAGKNKIKSHAVLNNLNSDISREDKKIQKKYYVIEMDNTMIMEDKRFRQESPWSWLLKYKIRSVLDYGMLPGSTDYVDVNALIAKLKQKFPNAILSINIGTEISDSMFAYESLIDIGALTKENVLVTVSPGNYEDTDGITDKIKDFKYYTMQRIAFQMLEDRIIDVKNFKIAINADQLSAKLKDNKELYNDYLNLKVRSGMNTKLLNKVFIKKWIDKYPEMFYSEKTPMDFYSDNREVFDKEYEKESKLANPKVNFKKTKASLKAKIEEDKKNYY